MAGPVAPEQELMASGGSLSPAGDPQAAADMGPGCVSLSPVVFAVPLGSGSSRALHASLLTDGLSDLFGHSEG